jgi:hypothetical protein
MESQVMIALSPFTHTVPEEGDVTCASMIAAKPTSTHKRSLIILKIKTCLADEGK